MDSFDIHNLKKYKHLGSGVTNSTYKVKVGNKTYAYQIGHILSKELKNKNSMMWNCINFFKTMGKYKGFIKLHNYKIIKGCKYKHQLPKFIIPFVNNDKKFYNKVKNKCNSKYCLVKCMDYIKGIVLQKIFHKLNLKEKYKCILQMIDFVIQMKKYGYRHRDMHKGNFIYSKGKLTIIDYEMCIKANKMKYECKKEDKEINKNSDLLFVVWNCWKYKLFKKIADKKVEPISYKTFKNNTIKSKEFKSIKFTDPKLPVEVKLEIFCVMFPELAQKLTTKKIKKFIPNKFLIPKEDVLYMYHNIRDINKVRSYIVNNLSNIR